jgi:hypothetical protein
MGIHELRTSLQNISIRDALCTKDHYPNFVLGLEKPNVMDIRKHNLMGNIQHNNTLIYMVLKHLFREINHGFPHISNGGKLNGKP